MAAIVAATVAIDAAQTAICTSERIAASCTWSLPADTNQRSEKPSHMAIDSRR
jgi:hypothetical protein